jgi:RNA polymerase sigma-70 factor (ECF subfamily)
MPAHATTASVQRYLDALAGDKPAEPLVRELLSRAVRRLQMLCANMLYRKYERLTRPPLNLDKDEMLSAVVERLLKALNSIRPPNVRAFFALANQHMRWELNDLARRLDKQPDFEALHEETLDPKSPDDTAYRNRHGNRLLEAIEKLPDDEREIFGLVYIQELSHAEAADVLGVATKTIQRRLNRAMLLLKEQLPELGGLSPSPS